MAKSKTKAGGGSAVADAIRGEIAQLAQDATPANARKITRLSAVLGSLTGSRLDSESEEEFAQMGHYRRQRPDPSETMQMRFMREIIAVAPALVSAHSQNSASERATAAASLAAQVIAAKVKASEVGGGAFTRLAVVLENELDRLLMPAPATKGAVK